MNVDVSESGAPFTYRHNVHDPLPTGGTCFVWFKIKDYTGSEIGLCFDTHTDVLRLVVAANVAAADLKAKQEEFLPMKEWAQQEIPPVTSV